MTGKNPVQTRWISSRRYVVAAGELIMTNFQKKLQVEDKDDGSPVTSVDRSAEALIRKRILDDYPDDSISGEELEPHQGNSGYRWIIDPIDGTRAFTAGRSQFGTLIALLHEERIVFGVIHNPATREQFTAGKNLGCIKSAPWLASDQEMKTSNTNQLKDAVLATTSPDLFDDTERTVFDHLRKKVKNTIYGGDCLNYGLLGLGTVDIVMESSLKLHDYAALIPIVEESGGVLSDWNGKSVELRGQTQILAAANPQLHREVMQLIRSLHRSA